jgi:hypothetical protein
METVVHLSLRMKRRRPKKRLLQNQSLKPPLSQSLLQPLLQNQHLLLLQHLVHDLSLHQQFASEPVKAESTYPQYRVVARLGASHMVTLIHGKKQEALLPLLVHLVQPKLALPRYQSLACAERLQNL